MRRQRVGSAAGVSLFPFLAVLICTMGALIVLLVMVVQQARVDASVIAQREADAKRNSSNQREQQDELEEFEWRWEELEKSRTQLREKLAEQRLVLSHLEDHIRQLEKRWSQVQDDARELERAGDSRHRELADVRDELARLRAAIDLAKQELEQARQQAASRPHSFAVVPYAGPNGTQRRPVYIECTATAVVLQPAGIALTRRDFLGPLGPGNPLDAALRMIREYLAAHGGSAKNGEPYPLLLVRPDGIEAYALARAAMRDWDDEFGYELIDADMEMKYPDPDPQLAAELARAIEDARRRQAILAAAMPGNFGEKKPSGFVVSPHRGGLVPVGELPGDDWPTEGRKETRYAGRDQAAEGDQDASSAAGPTAGSSPPAQAADAPANGNQGAPPEGSVSLRVGSSQESNQDLPANSRGENWGLPNATRHSTGITRPIRVACLPDQLIILPERGTSQQPVAIALRGPTRESLDEFMSAIWQRMEQWGIAVASGYWKPVLQVEVAPGGEQRMADLTALLDRSGIRVERMRR